MAVLCNICEVLIDLFYKISAFVTICRSLSSLLYQKQLCKTKVYNYYGYLMKRVYW